MTLIQTVIAATKNMKKENKERECLEANQSMTKCVKVERTLRCTAWTQERIP